ncbi:MAG: hypothetical protein QUT30_04820 [Acidobacteriota bacterium]|nr:hypothetical protein [Acidobacteriota bacterium]
MNMKSKGILFVLTTIFLLAPTLPGGDMEFEASGSVLSHYMWRGMRLSEGGVFQPSATVGAKGFSANIWANYQFDPNRWTEVDFTASYAGEKGNFKFEAGFVHYGVNEDEDSDEIFGGIGHSNLLNPSFKVFVDVNAGKGAYLQAGLEPSVPLGKDISLNFKAFAGYVLKNSYMGVNDGGFEFSNFYNADFQTSLSIPLNKNFSLEPMIGYSTSLSRNARQAIRNYSVSPRGDALYGGATLTFSLE